MGDARVRRTLVASLAKAADRFDRNVALRALLTAMPSKVYHRQLGKVVEVDLGERTGASLVNSWLRRVNGGAEFYRPGPRARPTLARDSLRAVLRDLAAGGPADDAVDAGFEALRLLSSSAEAFDQLPVSEWVSLHLGPFALCADQEGGAAPGTLLVTHPVACLRQPALHQAVVLVAEQGKVALEGQHLTGVMGIVLNRPSRLTLKHLLQATGDEAALEDLAPLHDNLVYVGGDVLQDRLLLLHPHPWLPGAAEVCPGVYISTDPVAVRDAVRSGRADAASFKLFVGHCGWAADQLAVECERGVWFLAEGAGPGAVADLAVGRHCLIDDAPGQGGDDSFSVASLRPLVPDPAPAGEGTIPAWPQYLDPANRAVYCSLLAQLSPEHASLCQLAMDPDTLLEHVQATVERHHDSLAASLGAEEDPLMPGDDDRRG